MIKTKKFAQALMSCVKFVVVAGTINGLFLFSTAADALPRSFNWKFCGWSGGGAFPFIYADPVTPGTVWAVSDVTGILKSDDYGDSWKWSTKGMKNVGGSTIVQAPSNSSVFYHASGRTPYAGAVHRSVDGGTNWLNQGLGDNYRVDISGHKAIAVNRADSNIAYLGNVSGDIFRTTDGTTWALWRSASQVGLGKITAMSVDTTNNYLWVGSASGLCRISIADGSLVTRTLSGTNANKNTDIVSISIAGGPYVFVAAGDRVAYTADNGLNWSYMASIGISSSNHINRLMVAPGPTLATTKIMAAYTTVDFSFKGGLVKSSNGGASWSNAYGSIQQGNKDNPTREWQRKSSTDLILTLSVDPLNPARWWIADFWGIFRTDDFGLTWVEKVKGAGNTVISDVRIAPNGDILVASMDNGLLKSSDGGLTWGMLIPNATPGQNYPEIAGHIWKVIATGNQAQWNAGVGHVIATDWPWNAPEKNKILRSTDNGKTWSVITGSGIPNISLYSGIWGDGYARAIDYTAGKILVGLDGYFGNTNGGVFESTDDGLTWVRKTPNPQPAPNYGNDWKIYNGLARNPADAQNIIYGTFNGSGIHYTLDGGSTWQSPAAGNQFYVYDIKFGSDGTVYACGGSGRPSVYRSKDKGVTWTLIWEGPLNYGAADGLEIDPSNADRLVVSTTTYSSEGPNKVFMTENARAASPVFMDITGNLPDGQGMASCAFRNSEGANGFLYCGRYAGGVFKMDMADSSQPPTEPPAPTPISDTSSPSAPLSLSAVLAEGHVQLTWGVSTDNIAVTGYQILNNGAVVGTSPTTSYAFGPIMEGVTYSFSVKAFDGANNFSSSSNTATLTIEGASQDTSAPTTPLNLTSALSGTQVSLSWQASTDNVAVIGYQILNNGSAIATSAATTFTHNANAGATNNYAVQAYDAAGNKSVSGNLVTVTIPPAKTGGPTVPTNLTATLVGTQVQLSWGPSTNNMGYNVYRNNSYLKTVGTTSTFDNSALAGNTYSYAVQSYDGSDTRSDMSNAATVTMPGAANQDTQPPTTPTNMKASMSGNSLVTNWNASTDNVAVNLYKIFNGSSQIATSNATSHSFVPTASGVTYNLTVQACDAAKNCSASSNVATVTTPDMGAPSGPTGFGAVVSGTQVILSWKASTDDVSVSGYKIFESDALIGDTASTDFMFGPITAGRTYLFSVKAFDSANNVSVSSNVVVVPILDTTPPTAPPNLSKSVTGSKVVLTWGVSTDNIGVSSYRVFEGTGMIATTTTTTYTAENLLPDKNYTYTVKAVDGANNISTSSNPVTVGVAGGLSIPANLIAYSPGSSIYVAWSTSSNAAGYAVYRNDVFLKNITSGSLYDSAVTAGATYTYKVQAYNASNVYSGFSSSVSVTLPALLAPEGLVGVRSGDQVNLSWHSVQGAAGYNIYRDGSYMKSMGTTVTTDNVSHGQTYSYKIKAYNSNGLKSPASNEVTV